MRLFFLAISKSGIFSRQEADRLGGIIAKSINIAPHISHSCRIFVGHDSTLWGVSTLDECPFLFPDPQHVIGVCGYVPTTTRLDDLRPSKGLASAISAKHGRFSSFVANTVTGEFSLAVPSARVDAIFTAENEDYIFWGNQASVVCMLAHGEIRYSVAQMVTFLSAGFYGDDSTPFDGVTALPPFTTVHAEARRVGQPTTHTVGLQSFKWHPWSFEESMSDLIGAMRGIPSDEVQISLSGGRDSRIILASALQSGAKISATTTEDDHNWPDVHVARQVAGSAAIPHAIVKRAARVRNRGDLLAVTKANLVGSDGMLAYPYSVSFSPAAPPSVGLNGLGGETLRAGYGEKFKGDYSKVFSFYRSLFGQHGTVFNSIGKQLIQERVSAIPLDTDPIEIMDCLYVDLRCGRWVSASSNARTMRLSPFLDNRFSLSMLKTPAEEKRADQFYRYAFEQTCPQFLEIPLARRHWKHEPGETRRERESRHPGIYERATPPQKRDQHFEERRQYARDRLDIFSPILDLDKARVALSTPDPSKEDARLANNLHAAAVMMTETWR